MLRAFFLFFVCMIGGEGSFSSATCSLWYFRSIGHSQKVVVLYFRCCILCFCFSFFSRKVPAIIHRTASSDTTHVICGRDWRYGRCKAGFAGPHALGGARQTKEKQAFNGLRFPQKDN